jgi:hypothetical protein
VRRHAQVGLLDARPDRVEDRIGGRAAAPRVVPPAVGVAGHEHDQRRTLPDHPLQLLDGPVDVGE